MSFTDLGLFVVLLVIYGFSAVLLWQNRGAEKIVTTAIPVAVAGLVGIGLAVYIFGVKAPISATFPVAYLLERSAKFPFLLQGRPGSYGLSMTTVAIGIRDADPSSEIHKVAADTDKDSFGQTLYHHALQFQILEWLRLKYPTHWKMEISPIGMGSNNGWLFRPEPSAVNEKVMRFSASDVNKKMAGNLFANLKGGGGTFFGLGLPPDSRLTIQPPHNTTDRGDVSSIEIKNPFCTLVIETLRTSAGMGIGSYQYAGGLTTAQNDLLANASYSVTVRGTFSRFKAGHPNMSSYQKWIQDIVNGLQEEFDERIVWKKTQEELMFRHALR